MGKKQTEIRFDDGTYYNDKGQKVIVDRLTSTVYTVSKHDEKKYNFFKSRYAIVLALSMFTCAFIDLKLGVLVLLVTGVIAEALYRLWFLPSLVIDDKATIPPQPSILQKYAKDNIGTLIFMMICAVALVVLLIVYCVQNIVDIKNALSFKSLNESIILYGSVILIALAIYVFYICIVILKERKQEKK